MQAEDVVLFGTGVHDMVRMVAWTVSMNSFDETCESVVPDVQRMISNQILTYVQDTHKIDWRPRDLARLMILIRRLAPGKQPADDHMFRDQLRHTFPSVTWADAWETWRTFQPQYQQAIEGDLLLGDVESAESISNEYPEAIEKIASGHWEALITEETVILRAEEELRTPRGGHNTRSSTPSALTNRLVSLEGYYTSEWRSGTLERRDVGRWIKGTWNEHTALIEWESGHSHPGVYDDSSKSHVIFPSYGRQYGRLLFGWQHARGVGLAPIPPGHFATIPPGDPPTETATEAADEEDQEHDEEGPMHDAEDDNERE